MRKKCLGMTKWGLERKSSTIETEGNISRLSVDDLFQVTILDNEHNMLFIPPSLNEIVGVVKTFC